MKRFREPIAIAVTTVLLLACVAPRIETRSRVEGRLESVHTVDVLLANVSGEGLSNDELPPSRELSEQAAVVLRSKGYRIAAREESDVRMAISARIDRVIRRTWSSDPDASALREIEIDEAVIVVAVFDDTSTKAVWSVEARSPLSRRQAFFFPTRDEIWVATLREAIEAFPISAPGGD
ncbi:MAG: hypothetical protein JRF61_21510 [Deltaproteobacteria bacterium]|jgi:hypothetical protein|nr:hypothetical protein [Deltaproteobacteria bacterium]